MQPDVIASRRRVPRARARARAAALVAAIATCAVAAAPAQSQAAGVPASFHCAFNGYMVVDYTGYTLHGNCQVYADSSGKSVVNGWSVSLGASGPLTSSIGNDNNSCFVPLSADGGSWELTRSDGSTITARASLKFANSDAVAGTLTGVSGPGTSGNGTGTVALQLTSVGDIPSPCANGYGFYPGPYGPSAFGHPAVGSVEITG